MVALTVPAGGCLQYIKIGDCVLSITQLIQGDRVDRLSFALSDMENKIGLIPSDTRQITGNITGDYERFTILGESRSKRSGAILFFDDGGYWAMNHKTSQKCSGYPNQTTHFIPRRIEQNHQKQKIENYNYIRKIAMHIYANGHPVDVTFLDGHPYLNKKQISSTGILSCQDCHMEYRRDWLMFPLVDIEGFANIQFISKEGDKRFLKGAKKKGTFGVFGLYQKTMPVLLTEGVATARTLYDVLKTPVFYGVDAGNLTHALATIIAKHEIDTRLTKITIAADYDENGIGETKAIQALKDNLIPINNTSLILPKVNVSTDWNDILVNYTNGEKHIAQRFLPNNNQGE